MNLNKKIGNYCQGKFHRIFLLLSVIGIAEVSILLGTFKFFMSEIPSFPIFLIMSLLVLGLAAFIASEGKHLFR